MEIFFSPQAPRIFRNGTRQMMLRRQIVVENTGSHLLVMVVEALSVLGEESDAIRRACQLSRIIGSELLLARDLSGFAQMPIPQSSLFMVPALQTGKGTRRSLLRIKLSCPRVYSFQKLHVLLDSYGSELTS